MPADSSHIASAAFSDPVTGSSPVPPISGVNARTSNASGAPGGYGPKTPMSRDIRPGPLAHDVGIFGPYPPGSPAAFEVRAFSPQLSGVGEDPVTGSLNASLAMWLLSSGKATAPYTASQGTALGRRGRVHVTADADGAPWIGGGTHTMITGSVHL